MPKKPKTTEIPQKEAKICCQYSELAKIEDLKPHPKNPNKHPESQINLLSYLINNLGWRHPITVSKSSGFIVKGHGRLAAAKLLGLKQVPVEYQQYKNNKLELADLIADNRISELAEFDFPMLKDYLSDLDDGTVDMRLTGFEEKDLENLFAGLPQLSQDTQVITIVLDQEEYNNLMNNLEAIKHKTDAQSLTEAATQAIRWKVKNLA